MYLLFFVRVDSNHPLFYSPRVSFILASSTDILLKTCNNWNKIVNDQGMRSYFFKNKIQNMEIVIILFVITSSALHNAQDNIIHSIIMSRNCYTHQSISPDLPINHPSANAYNSNKYAMKNDPKICQIL